MCPRPDYTDIHVSEIGQADDIVCVTDCLVKLSGLVYLSKQYCDSYNVELVPEKTKLLMFCPFSQPYASIYASIINNIRVSGIKIPLSQSTEHVGVLKTPNGGNMLHILDRVSAHRRAPLWPG